MAVDAWDLWSYDQKWTNVQVRDSSVSDVGPYQVMMVSYPCTQKPTCWNALERFTNSSRAKVVMYTGEPPSQCCGNADMWYHLCHNWQLRTAEHSSAGLPGHSNHVMVFTRRGMEEGGNWCEKGKNCPEDTRGLVRDYVNFCK